MSNGLGKAIAAGTTTITGLYNGHTATIGTTVTAPATLNHLTYTLSSSSATVGGAAPTGTVAKWQDAGETTPYTGSASLSYTSSNPSVATINSTTGVITLVAAGSCTFTVTDSVSGKTATTATLTVAAAGAGTFAWNATAPDATALVSDWPARDYASETAFKSNSLSRYANTSFGSEVSFDSTYQFGGYPTLKMDRNLGSSTFTKLIVPSPTTQTDLVYHVRRQTQSALSNDTFPALTYTNWRSFQNGNLCAIAGLGFNPASYSYRTDDYGAGGTPDGMIALLLDYHTGDANFPHYRLAASVQSNAGTVLSDTTSQAGVLGPYLGDEMFASANQDVFFRVKRGTESGSGKPALFIEAHIGLVGSQPLKIGPVTLTMLDSSTPPMPTHGFCFIQEPSFLPNPRASRLMYHQLLDNAAHPNVALDFGNPIIPVKYQGLGTHGAGIGTRTIDLSLYASNADFQAKIDDTLSGAAGTASRITGFDNSHLTLVPAASSDAAHRNLPYVRNQQTGGQTGGPGRIFSDFQNRTQHFWSKESWLWSSGWTGFGAGIKCATFTTNVTASASAQTVGYADANGGGIRAGHGTAGFGTAGFEGINITAVDTANHTITAVFSQNHASGDEIAYGPGPDYKILQANLRVNGVSEVARLEEVFGTYESYFSTVEPDANYPAFSEIGAAGVSVQGVGIFRTGVPAAGSIADSFAIPAINDNGYAARPGPLAGQTVEVQSRAYYAVWYDADYGRWRHRVMHALQAPGQAPAFLQFAEGMTIYTAADDLYFESIHYGENYNDRPITDQYRDQWDQQEVEGDLLSDPFGVLAAAGLSLPAAATLGSPTAATTTLTYPVTAPSTGPALKHVIAEVLQSSGFWMPTTATPAAWTAGLGGTQNVVVTGLTTGTNYANKIRFRLVSALGMGTPVVASTGTTS